jgi:primary-amine oxidase
VPGVEPLFTPFECFEAERLVKADPQVRALLESRYGITPEEVEEHVAADPWSVHDHGDMKGRLVQTFLYWRASTNDNAYAHPINMVPVVDLRTGKIVRIDAPEPALPINKQTHNYHRDLIETGFRADPPKPLNITQPDGPSFTVSAFSQLVCVWARMDRKKGSRGG